MTNYEAVVTADMGGYTSSLQQAIALTKEYAAANEGMVGMVGRTGTRMIGAMNNFFGVQQKMMKANISEAARYEQMLGGVSAKATAAGKSAEQAQKTTLKVARDLTGSIGSAVEAVTAVQSMGFTTPKGITEMSRAMVELSASTGESGSAIAASLQSIDRVYTKTTAPSSIRDLGDSLVSVTSKFGASAQGVASFSEQLAPFAKQIGMSRSSVLGFSTAFARMGQDGFRSANVFSKVLTDIDMAVREGLPTLGTYAQTMGLTYKEAKQLAENSPEQFVIGFVEALDKQGTSAVRTLESLGLEGVRNIRTLKALASSGDLQDIIQSSGSAYGSKSTAEAAAEQLEGINEQAGKMQESLRQVVVNSGKPMLGFLEELTGASTKAASGLASLTGSDAMQTLMGLAVGGAAALSIGGKIASTGVGAMSMVPLLGMANTMGTKGIDRFKGASNWLAQGNNRMKVMGGAGAGMMLGSMTGMPSLEVAGMLGLTAASMMGPGMVTGARGVRNFLFRDAAVTAQLPMREWLQDNSLDKRMDRVYAAQMAAGATGFVPGRATRIGGTNDQISLVRKAIKSELKAGNLADPDMLKRYDAMTGVIGRGGKRIEFDREIAGMANLVKQGKLTPAEMVSQITSMEARAAGGYIAPQTAGMKARYGMGQTGAFLSNIFMGGGGQLLKGAAGLLMNPMVGIPAAGLAAVGGGFWLANKSRERNEERQNFNVEASATAAERYGYELPDFKGLVLSGEKLASTFDELSDSVKKNQKAAERGGSGPLITRSMFNQMEPPEGAGDTLKHQNRKFLWQTLGTARNDAEAQAEMLAVFGTRGDADQIAAMAMELKAQGKSYEEVMQQVGFLQEIAGDNERIFQTAYEEWKSNENKPWRKQHAPDLVQTWLADLEGLSDDQKAMQLYDIIDRQIASGEVSPADAQKYAREVFEAANIGEYATDFGVDPFEKLEAESGGFAAWVSRQLSGTPQPGENKETPEEAAAREERERKERRDAWMKATGIGEASELEGGLQARGLAGITGYQSSFQTAATQAGGLRSEEEYESRRGKVDQTSTSAAYKSLDAQGRQFVESAGIVADTMLEAADNFKEGDFAQNIMAAEKSVAALAELYGGNEQEALAQVKALQRTTPADSTMGKVLAQQEEILTRQIGIQESGMDQWAQLQERKSRAGRSLEETSALVAAGEASGEVQAEWAAAHDELKAVEEEEIAFMQNYLKAYKAHNLQLSDMEADYQRSRRYAVEDYNTQVSQATENFQRQQRYMTEDHNKQQRYMQEDYDKNILRSTREYNKQRERLQEDFDRSMARRAEDAAKSMYDPFQRIAREQTWSGEGLLGNLREQNEMFAKQAENLDALRGAGIDQSVIDALGLNDPKKAQQVQRMLDDITSGGIGMVDAFNQAIGERVDLGGLLFGTENDQSAIRMEEDFKLQLERMAEDRKTWLADAQADFDQQRKRAEEAFQTSMTRAQEGFDTTMKYMRQAHEKSLTRMEEAHATSMDRSRRNFELQFEAMGSNYEALAEATTAALKGETPKWDTVVTNGLDSMRKKFAEGVSTSASGAASDLTKSLERLYGPDSPMIKVIVDTLKLIGMGGDSAPGATTGGPVSSGEAYTGPDTGLLYPTGGKGRVSQKYLNYNPKLYPKNLYHFGVDIGTGGTKPPLYSMVKGTVIDTSYQGGHGNRVLVRVEDPRFPGDNMAIHYGHMSSFGVRPGQKVNRGDFVGHVGSTGYSTGPHVHVQAMPGRRNSNGSVTYSGHANPYKYFWQGGIATRPTDAVIAEGGYPEAVIPLNQRGVDILAEALSKAYGASALQRASGAGGGAQTVITHIVNEDHSVNVTGTVEVVSSDPDKVLRDIERRARERALVAPNRRA